MVHALLTLSSTDYFDVGKPLYARVRWNSFENMMVL